MSGMIIQKSLGTLSLNPNIDSLWQQSLSKIPKTGDVWYANAVLGHNPIEKFMSKISGICSLSDYYTNHCTRVTSATNLTRSNFTAKQVMSVTGHKSIQSLASYQRVREDDKMAMGISLTYSLMYPTEVQALLDVIEKEKKGKKKQQKELEAPPMPKAIAPPPPNNQVTQNHALDPANNNILPLESALVPYETKN